MTVFKTVPEDEIKIHHIFSMNDNDFTDFINSVLSKEEFKKAIDYQKRTKRYYSGNNRQMELTDWMLGGTVTMTYHYSLTTLSDFFLTSYQPTPFVTIEGPRILKDGFAKITQRKPLMDMPKDEQPIEDFLKADHVALRLRDNNRDFALERGRFLLLK